VNRETEGFKVKEKDLRKKSERERRGGRGIETLPAYIIGQ